MEPKPKQIKRGHQSQSSSDTESSISISRITVSNWPEYLIIQAAEDGELTKNPFLTAKTIQGIAGEVISVKRLRQGDILVHCSTRSQAKNLLQMKTFASCPCTVLPHRSLNSSKGIIRDRERCLQSLSEDDLVRELADQGVTHVKRFTVRKDSGIIKTHTYLITFSCASLPREIKAGYHNIKVDVYVPNPLRCYKCQRYGHGATKCTNAHACHRCGSDEHEGFDCTNPPSCKNCNGSHMASSKQCPIWIREAEICKIKVHQNISFPEARKLVLSQQKSSSSSYAAVTKSQTVKAVSTRTVSCQTHTTWINTEIPMCTPVRTVTVAHAEASAQTQAQSTPKTTTSTIPTTKSSSASLNYAAVASMATSVAAIQLYQSSSQPSSSQPSASSSQSSTSSSKSSSSPPTQRSKDKSKRAAKAQSGRPHKGEDDPIQSFNRYSSLDEMDIDPTTTTGRPVSVSPRRGHRRSPVKHPP